MKDEFVISWIEPDFAMPDENVEFFAIDKEDNLIFGYVKKSENIKEYKFTYLSSKCFGDVMTLPEWEFKKFIKKWGLK